MYIGTRVNSPIGRMTYCKDTRKYTVPSILHLSITNDNISGLAALPMLALVIAVGAARSLMIRITAHMTSTFSSYQSSS